MKNTIGTLKGINNNIHDILGLKNPSMTLNPFRVPGRAFTFHRFYLWLFTFNHFVVSIGAFIIILLSPVWVVAQFLPVGTPVLEDYYRRAQLLGEIDSSISFTSRPIYPY